MGVLKIINISLKRGKYKIDIKKSKSHKLQSTIPKLRLKPIMKLNGQLLSVLEHTRAGTRNATFVCKRNYVF